MKVRTLVDVDLRAFHTDPHMDEGRHEHVWNVQAVFDGSKFADARWDAAQCPARWEIREMQQELAA